MTMEMFSIFDQALQVYREPFAAQTIAFAIRAFSEPCRQEGHEFNRHPADFALYHVGQFNLETGVFTPSNAHKIAMASNFIAVDEGD